MASRIFFVPLQMMENNGIEAIRQTLESRLKQVDQTILELMRLKEDMISLMWKLRDGTHFKVEGFGGMVTYWSKEATQSYGSAIYPTRYKFSDLSEEEWSHLPSWTDVSNLLRNCTNKPNEVGGRRGLEFTSKDGSTLFLPFYHERDFGEIWLLNAEKFRYSENICRIVMSNESDYQTAYIHYVIRVANGAGKP